MASLPDVTTARVVQLARALGDPVRLRIVDELRVRGEEVCVCELQPLFDVSQPTLSHHLKTLREAGIVRSERRGSWAFYSLVPGALDELAGWLTP